MKKRSKRYLQLQEKINKSNYVAEEAVNLVKEISTANFNESVDVNANLNIDPKYADQQLRATLILPEGTGQVKKIAALVDEDQFEQAKNEWEKAQQTVKTINEQAEVTIQQVQSQLNDQFSQDIKKLEQTKQLTIQFEKQKILLQIRQQISQLAFKQANQKIQLKLVNPDVQRKLIDQKINLLNTIE